MTVLRRRKDSDSEPEPEGYVPPPPQASLGDALAQALNQVHRVLKGLSSGICNSISFSNLNLQGYREVVLLLLTSKRMLRFSVQGDTSACSKPPVDIDLRVTF